MDDENPNGNYSIGVTWKNFGIIMGVILTVLGSVIGYWQFALGKWYDILDKTIDARMMLQQDQLDYSNTQYEIVKQKSDSLEVIIDDNLALVQTQRTEIEKMKRTIMLNRTNLEAQAAKIDSLLAGNFSCGVLKNNFSRIRDSIFTVKRSLDKVGDDLSGSLKDADNSITRYLEQKATLKKIK